MAAAGRLNEQQMTYAGPTKPLEALYDTQRDPYQLKNLAELPEYRDQLERMRRTCRRWSLETGDLGFLPESLLWAALENDTPWELRLDAKRYPLERIIRAADLVGRSGDIFEQTPLLKDEEPAVRFWAIAGCRANRSRATELERVVDGMLEDPVAAVRITAATAMLQQDHAPALAVLTREVGGRNLNDALMAARALQSVGDLARSAIPAMRSALRTAQAEEGNNPLSMFIRFSLEQALEDLEPAKDQ